MTEQETLKIIRYIADNYQARFKVEDPKGMVVAWHKSLRQFDFEDVQSCLSQLIAHMPFPPVLADLIRAIADEGRAIPNAEQTKAMLAEMEPAVMPPSDHEITSYLTRIHERIKGGEVNHGTDDTRYIAD